MWLSLSSKGAAGRTPTADVLRFSRAVTEPAGSSSVLGPGQMGRAGQERAAAPELGSGVG